MRHDASKLSPADAGRALGVTAARVKQLDDVLAPERDSSGRRLYDAGRVETLAGRRDAERAARGCPHALRGNSATCSLCLGVPATLVPAGASGDGAAAADAARSARASAAVSKRWGRRTAKTKR